MTAAEARTVLGLDPGVVDARTARRAYLRAVKRHKPEQDPEGFQRVRTAWEVLQRHLSGPIRAPRATPPPERPEPARREPVPPPPPPEPDPVPEAEADPPQDPPDPGGLPEPLRWERAPDIDPRPWTVEPIPEPSPGAPEPPPSLASPRQPPREPELLPADHLVRALEAASVDGDLALDHLRAALAGSRTHPDLAPSVLDVLTPVLLLHQAGDARAALQAWTLLDRWIDDLGLGTRVAQSVAGRMIFARELSDLPLTFPADLRRLIATAVLENRLHDAFPELDRFRQSFPLQSREAEQALRDQAPALAKLYADTLHVEPEPDPANDEGALGWIVPLFLILFGLVLAGLVGLDSSAPPPKRFAPIFQPSPFLMSPLCSQLPSSCDTVVQLSAAVTLEDCERAQTAWNELETLVEGELDRNLSASTSLLLLRPHVVDVCPELR